jgi:16S rRNA processing protein RimM
MRYIYIGDLVNTHGIKGEAKVISSFEYKDQVFKKDITVYIGSEKVKEVINSYRPHQKFELITLKGIDTIGDIIPYKGDSLYVDGDELDITGNFNEDIIGLEVYTDKPVGKVKYILKSKAHDILVLDNKNMIPYIDKFIKEVDLDKKIIYINNMEGLIHED